MVTTAPTNPKYQSNNIDNNQMEISENLILEFTEKFDLKFSEKLDLKIY